MHVCISLKIMYYAVYFRQLYYIIDQAAHPITGQGKYTGSYFSDL